MVSTQPTTSVVIPTFRRPLLLERCLESVLRQTRQPDEVKVVASDPHERQAVVEIVRQVGLPQADVISGSHGLLGGQARNLGWKSCTSEVVMFVDDDDYWDDEKIFRHLSRHQETSAEVVYSGVTYVFDSSGKSFPRHAKPLGTNVKAALTSDGFCPPTTSCVSVRRAALESVSGFDDSLQSYQDWDLWYRLADTCKFESIPDPLTYFVQHRGDRVSMQTERRLAAAKQLLHKYGHSTELVNFLDRELLRTIERALVFAAQEGDAECFSRYYSEIQSRRLGVANWRTYWILLKMLAYVSDDGLKRILGRRR
ncbi:glycosyltransferase [Bradyrhizobium sp. 151]|uniref:glycosyltransferase family 2 protein n=1 Tax=Bradyrhizobium sp. 151 TaxID=2782626 RepID=UPI001FF98987|nr:glycosyltransferase [Bradyrhizobium sp. 151]MCK1663443.1 glycosyltransferase [Bradyrhizobium sp. 151]